MYILQHLEFLEKLPEFLQEKMFSKVMDIATISKLDKKERVACEESLKQYRDLKNVLDSSFEKGRVEHKIEDGRNLHKLGISSEIISKATGLSMEALKKILAA